MNIYELEELLVPPLPTIQEVCAGILQDIKQAYIAIAGRNYDANAVQNISYNDGYRDYMNFPDSIVRTATGFGVRNIPGVSILVRPSRPEKTSCGKFSYFVIHADTWKIIEGTNNWNYFYSGPPLL
jgi:hypothetical protein